MSSISHPPARTAQEPGWASLLRRKEVWASLAITAMWIAVAVTASGEWSASSSARSFPKTRTRHERGRTAR